VQRNVSLDDERKDVKGTLKEKHKKVKNHSEQF